MISKNIAYESKSFNEQLPKRIGVNNIMSKGVIHILTTPSFSQYLKIDYAGDMESMVCNSLIFL